MTDALTVRSRDLGFVQMEGRSWRSVAFDLTEMPAEACRVVLSLIAPHLTALRVGEALECDPFVTDLSLHGCHGRTHVAVPLTARGVEVVNLAQGGQLTLDLWIDDGEGECPRPVDLQLTVEVVRPVSHAA